LLRCVRCTHATLPCCRVLACHAIQGVAVVCEYLSGNSIRSALRRRADVVRSPLARIKVALDAARVRGTRAQGAGYRA
jgi:hypothetical protein